MTELAPVDTDDLAPWADDDLVRALRAPGTATELADQERYVAAFRETRGSTVRSLPRRAAGRLGAGGTAVVVTVALTSGVAAAYTGRLPDPVQQIAHSVIGAPAPDVDGRQHAEGSGPGAPLRHSPFPRPECLVLHQPVRRALLRLHLSDERACSDDHARSRSARDLSILRERADR